MTSTTLPALDAHRLRADFAVFDELFDGRPVAFLDSAASTQKPRQVNVGKHVSPRRMHQEERPPAAAGLKGHKRGVRAGRGLATENTGEVLDRRPLKDGRQRKLPTQLLLDEGEQTHRL